MPRRNDRRPGAPPERMLTIPDAAEICNVSTKTIRRWITEDKLRAVKLGWQWRIRRRDLEAALNDGIE